MMKKRYIRVLISVLIAVCMIPLCTVFAADYSAQAKSVTNLSTPSLSSAYVNNAGTVIKWNKVSGAVKYRVYYKVGNSRWRKIADTTSTSYTWSGAKTGTRYTFTVRCISSNGKAYTSGFDAVGKSIYYFPAPKLSSVSNTKTGVQVSWKKVSGAARYRIYRKAEGAAAWSSVGTSTSTSFTDKTAKSSVTYSYTVRCISGGSNTCFSGYEVAGKSIKYISAPVLSSVYVNNAGTVIKWNKVPGAEKYRIYYRIGNSSWTRIADTTSTSYIWNGAKTGTQYTITVRCITANASAYASGFDSAGKNIIKLSNPNINSLYAINSGTQIKWGKVSGAARYRVYRKKAGAAAWSSIGTTTSTTFVDTTAAKATNYSYTVRCVSKYALTLLSGYDVDGKSFTALSVPSISSVSPAVDGVQIKWGKVTKAEKYRVYRKTSGGSWVTLTTTSSTSFTDTKAKSGTKYYYTVRCVNKSATVYTSGYNTAGKSITFIAAPKISSIQATSSGIKLKWGKVNGAAKYKVFRKTANATSWTALGVTAYTNFTDVQAKKGTRYTYTVRCVNSSATSYTSWFDATGKSATSVSSPSTKNDMVQVAEKQLGYSGGRKIWSWAGYSRRVPWCNLFVTWCADQLGYYQSGRIPLKQAPKNSAKWFKSKGLFKNRNYIPKAGDLIFFAYQGQSSPYHIGIVEKYQNGYVYTIEGNLNDVVKKGRYSHKGNVYIYGYATPDYGHN